MYLHASPVVLLVIDSGDVLPLMSEPTQFHGETQPLAVQNAEFVGDSIAELVSGGCVRELESAPVICSLPLVVESNGSKKRLVVNLGHLNRFLYKCKFKYEDLCVAMLLFKQGDYMFSFGLKSGYHHTDIAEAHHKYLEYSWGEKLYVFTVLPFVYICIQCISSLHTSEPSLKPSTATMASIVHKLSETVESEEFVMHVRREHVLEDALRSLKCRTFSPNLTLSVCLFLMCTHTLHLNYM